MRICTLLGLLGGLFLAGWLVLSIFLWRKEKEASHRHKQQLRLMSTEALLARARNWGPMNRHAELPAVVEFRTLLEQHRYEEMLLGWRALTSSLFALEEHVSTSGPQVYDSDAFRVLRDYVEVLYERQQRGE